MSLVLAARVVAVVLSASTFIFLFLHDSWRSDNLFLVPDLIICAALLAGALLPARLAAPVLMIGLGAAAGVFATSVASYAVRGEFGAASLLGALTCAVTAALLAGAQSKAQASGRSSSA